MRSVSVSSGAPQPALAGLLTAGESSFRNAKLGSAALVAYKAAADVAGKGSIFVLTLVAARRLTPNAFGLFGLGTTVGWMLAVATDFGVQMHLARRVARAPQHAAATLWRWWRIRVAAIVAALVALAVGLMIAGVPASVTTPLLLFALVYSGTSLIELLNYFYRGLSRSDIESTLTIWQRAGTLVLGIAALLWWPDVRVLAAAMLLPIAAALGWSLRRAASMAAGSELAEPISGSSLDGDRFFRDVFPIGAGIVLSALYFRLDVVLVQLWAGTEAVAGYNAVFRLVDALRLFPAAVLAVMLPALCRAENLATLARVCAAVTAFAIVASAALWLGADGVVTLAFGETYRFAVPAFRVLLFAFPLLSLNFALTHQLVAWDRQRAYAGICAAALAVNVALNAWLIPVWSIAGAAWATLGTELCVTSGCVIALGALRRRA
jgi:O-antigen/teichoic acid export membrane protein